MRHFSSYGPVDREEHFCVERRELIDKCISQLIGNPDKGGHYFTIWGARQTGKTWLYRQAMDEVAARYGDRFLVGEMSMQGVILEDKAASTALLEHVPDMVYDAFNVKVDQPTDWKGFKRLFHKDLGIFDRPVVLLIDEFDSLPPKVMDRVVRLFRDIYLRRRQYWLHGLALVGVRAVLGVDSPRGSPFNVQRSLRVPNLTPEEATEMFRQYQDESGQAIDPQVVTQIIEVTRGQPGLVSWFGELLTEKYNTQTTKLITLKEWAYVYHRACHVEPNNTVLNLLAKARGDYREHVLNVFGHPDILFDFDKDWCNYLYLNGIIDELPGTNAKGELISVCRFSSPFIQLRLYNALTGDLFETKWSTLALDPLDALEDVFTPTELNLAALLPRYRDYLGRLNAKGLDPWQGQPRRQDLHLTEAVGHFHLYAWLRDAIGRECVVSPEFPTGNGKVDLLVRWKDKVGVIEVKSFESRRELPRYREQAARYAKSQGLTTTTLALFIPTQNEETLRELSSEEVVSGVRVTTVVISWG